MTRKDFGTWHDCIKGDEEISSREKKHILACCLCLYQFWDLVIEHTTECPVQRNCVKNTQWGDPVQMCFVRDLGWGGLQNNFVFILFFMEDCF